MTSVTTYQTLFSEPAYNPLGTGAAKIDLLTGLYQTWNASATTGTELLEAVLNHFERQAIGGIGFFVKGSDGQHRLEVVHGIRKYPGPLVEHSSLSNRFFGFHGDVSTNGFATTVGLTEDLFDATAEINLLKLDHHKTTLEDDPSEGHAPPVEDTAPQMGTQGREDRYPHSLPR